MDREPEEIQFLGPIGVGGEAYKLLLSWRRLLGQIAAAFILPPAFISHIHIQISLLLFTKPDASKIAAKKEDEKARETELNDLFKVDVSQPKVPIGVDSKSILCERQCAKGFK